MSIYLEGAGEGRERFGMAKHSGRIFTTSENLGEGKTEVLYTFLHPFQKHKIISKLQIIYQICQCHHHQ